MTQTDPHSVADLTQGRVTHIHLVWKVDFDARALVGAATLHLDQPAAGLLSLDTRELTVAQVLDQDGQALPWTLHPPEGFMGARLDVVRRPDTSAVEVRYRTAPTASALQWLAPANTAGKAHPFLFSQCQPIHARSMMPCQDTARARFTYSAEVTVPEGLVPVMSAAPGEPGTPVDGWVTTAFSMPQAIPSYLLALGVGHLVSADLGPRSRVYAEPESLQAAAWEFADADVMLRAAEGLFGPYPWERFDFLMMPPAFPYGGMENPRLTFLTPTLIAGDRSLVTVLAHELAHSWTGNLVTNATMNDFWLNEGFTVWAERRILEVLEGPEAVGVAANIGRHDLEEELARFADQPAYTHLETDLSGVDPDEVYSSVPYEKGFLFVQLLEETVGRTRWDAFIKAYMGRFGFTSITTAEFEAFLEEQLPGVRDAIGADAWIHGPGLPENAPRFGARRLEAVLSALAAWERGELDTEAMGRWTTRQRIVFLQKLPRPLTHEQCARLDQAFSLTASANAEILSQWLLVGLASGYAPALERTSTFLGEVGRMKFLKPLYAALMARVETQPAAASLLADYRELYHPIALAGLESMVEGRA
ncbi:MAG: M1 family metallopeptidase [Deltaproteobacteria bacterium]|nr:M1 family metallopeptidase [Deltaproteobacteria bacterium]